MELKDIISVPGMGGLYKVVANNKNGFIVESLSDSKRTMIASNQRIMTLVDIAVYTTEEDMPLREIYKKIQQTEGQKLGVDPKADGSKLREYFKKVVPTFDEERVYTSDIKKMLVWYELLKDKIDFSKAEETGGDADEKIISAAEHDKPIPKKHESHGPKAESAKATTAKNPEESLSTMTSNILNAPEKIRRNFLPANLDLLKWESIEPFYLDLQNRELNSIADLKKWLSDSTELESIIQEHVGWLYIRMTCDTTDKKLTDAYTHFVENINPKIEPFSDRLNKKFLDCTFRTELDKRYALYVKQVENSIRIFREENIALQAEMTVKEQKYGETAGAMTVEVNGKELTLQQASNFLKNPDRKVRDEVYHKIVARRQQDRDKLDALFLELIALRHRMARQAGFANFRDYKFVELDRFDYTPEDCLRFHESVRTAVVPVLDTLQEERKAQLNLDVLKPWDLSVDTQGREDMKPFTKGEELMGQTIRCFSAIHPYFGEVTQTLQRLNYVDLDSRIGKAPGGYNYPLYESGVPFIFMNASGSLRDVVTMVHEGGHAIHSMLTRDLDFIGFKELPSEVAELASMSMELISMEHWHHFFPNPDDLRRARREQLENVLETLPWIACVDHFQHWLYMNPDHTVTERTEAWKRIYLQFSSKIVDWSTDQGALEAMWQKQLHLFEVPFYYIEYGMAQLGAIAVWRNYKQNPEKAIEQYMNALRLGYSCSIPEVYSAAGIRFDFSEKYIHELVDFVKVELAKV